MKTPTFISFCLMLVAGMISLHALMQESFSPSNNLEKRLHRAQAEKEEASLRAQVIASELADYQQSVATLLPEAIKGEDQATAYPLRQLASLAAAGSGVISIERASGLFESGKQAFREKEFEESTQIFSKMLTRYPSSVHAAEAQFLLAEGQFQQKDYTSSASTIEKMIDQYPENELTGFALLRLGRIFEMQNRLEDAGDIYRSVLANFKQPELTRQADQNLKAVEL